VLVIAVGQISTKVGICYNFIFVLTKKLKWFGFFDSRSQNYRTGL